MNRASTLALVLLAFSGAAQPKDLAGVFEDAVHNDPVIRQADANRLAAREARPQALAALLPQLIGTAGISGAHTAGFQDQVFQPPTAERFQITTDTNTKQWAVNLRQNVFSWANWMALKEAGREVAQAESTYQAAEQSQGGARHRRRGRDSRQAHARDLRGPAAGNHRREVPAARQARRRHDAETDRSACSSPCRCSPAA